MTIMQNTLHSFGGDWLSVPSKASIIGPRHIIGRVMEVLVQRLLGWRASSQ